MTRLPISLFFHRTSITHKKVYPARKVSIHYLFKAKTLSEIVNIKNISKVHNDFLSIKIANITNFLKSKSTISKVCCNLMEISLPRWINLDSWTFVYVSTAFLFVNRFKRQIQSCKLKQIRSHKLNKIQLIHFKHVTITPLISINLMSLFQKRIIKQIQIK